jgi:hypothetical protein
MVVVVGEIGDGSTSLSHPPIILHRKQKPALFYFLVSTFCFSSLAPSLFQKQGRWSLLLFAFMSILREEISPFSFLLMIISEPNLRENNYIGYPHARARA